MSFLDRIRGPRGPSLTAPTAAGGAAVRADKAAAAAADNAVAESSLPPPPPFDELLPASPMEATVRLDPGMNAPLAMAGSGGHEVAAVAGLASAGAAGAAWAAGTSLAESASPVAQTASPTALASAAASPVAFSAPAAAAAAAPGSTPAKPLHQGSIISEAVPSELVTEFNETTQLLMPGDAGPVATGLPVVGSWALPAQQRAMLMLFVLGLLGLLAAAALALGAASDTNAQVAAVGQASTHSQRLAKSLSQAVLGHAASFAEVSESAAVVTRNLRGLKDGSGGLTAVGSAQQAALAAVLPMVDRTEKASATVLAQQKTLIQVGAALRDINRQSADLLDTAEAVASTKLQAGAAAPELAAVNQLAVLSQRIGKSANEFVTTEGVSAEAVFLLGKDLSNFRDTAQAVLEGKPEQNLPGTKEGAAREKLQQLLGQFENTRKQADALLNNMQGLVSAREARVAVGNDAEPLRKGLDELQQSLAGASSLTGLPLMLGLPALLLMGLGAFGLLRVFVTDQGNRSRQAHDQRLEAERQEREAKRVNDANQAAILRLMNELQTVSEGDLTQQATVTEDITGAIADSVNYTVEELRSLVAQVQSTVGRVTDTTAQVDETSTELLAASGEQLREIRDTGDSVLKMAGRINDVSAQAQETASVARQSLRAAETGMQAVQDAIGGMNAIRDQIQDTSKRIKRLGESSQEIGEITELISDITEQTNVLALNAAIQAASAGEAGRGFSVVAEEVQRLAVRSADATRQIAAIVRSIQTDTQDAVGAMERSTQGVVQGARLSDAAGAALTDIDRVTRELADLISRISEEALREARSANVVASNIQHIFAVTEQTSEGTRSTAQMVRDLSRMAEELKTSVARFKIV